VKFFVRVGIPYILCFEWVMREMDPQNSRIEDYLKKVVSILLNTR